MRASTPFEICGCVEVFRISIIVFLNLAECDMQCSDKVAGIFIGTRKCKCMHVYGGINAVSVPTKFGHAPLVGYIGMCRCEGYGFQAVYSRKGYINQSV